MIFSRFYILVILISGGKLHIGEGCHAKERYELLFKALGGVYFDGYETIKENICFKKGVFGYDKSDVRVNELEKLVLHRLNISASHCTKHKPRILIQKRKTRSITNTHDLATELRSKLNASVDTIFFEDIPLVEQIQQVHCADVFIGVQGAGLNHVRFLRPGAALIEVGWPHWPAGMYANVARRLKKRSATIGHCKASISAHSWSVYYDLNEEMRNKPKRQVYDLVRKVPFWSEKNIYKFADCELDIPKAVAKIQSLL